MPSHENRLTRCPQCNDTFTYKYRLPDTPDADPIITMTCPFCRAKLRVDLSPYCRDQIISYKGGETDSTGPQPRTFDLPPEIPAEKREEGTKNNKRGKKK